MDAESDRDLSGEPLRVPPGQPPQLGRAAGPTPVGGLFHTLNALNFVLGGIVFAVVGVAELLSGRSSLGAVLLVAALVSGAGAAYHVVRYRRVMRERRRDAAASRNPSEAQAPE